MSTSLPDPNQEQYQFVLELITRQDEVLGQIDELNERIESLIKNINIERQLENQRQAQAADTNSESGSVNSEVSHKAA